MFNESVCRDAPEWLLARLTQLQQPKAAEVLLAQVRCDSSASVL